MDADEALARALQAEEEAALAARQRLAAAHNLRGSGTATTQFAQQVEAAVSKVLSYEDELAQAMALSMIPISQLEAAAEEACHVSAAMGEEPPLDRQDALAEELLIWFKQHFFSWVNNPPCETCGSSSTQNVGVSAPTAEEAAHLAGRTEVYRCKQCGATTRFPRYNDPLKLLETRRGRCGEWANCFTLCCRATGLEARLVMDWEDHIWTEYWSPVQHRWIHLDPCEATADKPLLYEAGWGKKLSYVVAVGCHGASDVTRRYTRQYKELQRRRGLVGEEWLSGFLRHVTTRLRASLAPGQQWELEQRDLLEAQQLLNSASGRPGASGEAEPLPARQTGDAAWRAARGEDGSGGAAAASPPAALPPPPGTRYRLAKDSHLAAFNPYCHSHPQLRRLCGGAVRASGENPPTELAQCAFDGSSHTKWLDFGGKRSNGAWLEYRLPHEQPEAVVAAYAITSANDCPERDPRHVVLEAWAEDEGTWVVVDEQPSLRFLHRRHRLLIHVSGGAAESSSSSSSAVGGNAVISSSGTAVANDISGSKSSGRSGADGSVPASRRFRLRVVRVATPGTANSVQLAGLELYARQLGEHPPAEGIGQVKRKAMEQPQHPQQQDGQKLEKQKQQQPGDNGSDGTPPIANKAADAAAEQREQDAAKGLADLHLQPGPEQEAQQAQQAGEEAQQAQHQAQLQGQAQQQQPLQQMPLMGEAPASHPAEGGSADNPWAALFAGGPPS